VLMKEASLVDSIAAQLEKLVGQNAPAKTAGKHKHSDEAQVGGK